MFIVTQTPTYTAPVIVEMPSDNGKTKIVKFNARFKRLPQDEIDTLYDRIRDKDLDDEKLVHEVTVGWDGVADAQGTPLDFTPENFEQVLGIYPVQASLAKAFFNSLKGAKEKN